MQFYGDDQELAVSVADFLGEGLAAGGSAVVVATAAHRQLFEAALQPGTGMQSAGRLLMADADQMLHSFLAGDRLDGNRFEAAAEDLIGRAASAGQPVRIYAEMVALLWDADQVMLALELEALWNDLAARIPFSLLCGYPARLVAPGDQAEAIAVDQVRRLHDAVISPAPEPPGAGAAAGGAVAVRRFPPDPASARAAREFVLAALGSRASHAAGIDAAIVIAELAANAVVHARSEFTVTVSHPPDRVRISVRDQAPVNGSPPAVRHGHGLHMVAQIARWGISPLPGGKEIWAELPAPTSHPPS